MIPLHACMALLVLGLGYHLLWRFSHVSEKLTPLCDLFFSFFSLPLQTAWFWDHRECWQGYPKQVSNGPFYFFPLEESPEANRRVAVLLGSLGSLWNSKNILPSTWLFLLISELFPQRNPQGPNLFHTLNVNRKIKNSPSFSNCRA